MAGHAAGLVVLLIEAVRPAQPVPLADELGRVGVVVGPVGCALAAVDAELGACWAAVPAESFVDGFVGWGF